MNKTIGSLLKAVLFGMTALAVSPAQALWTIDFEDLSGSNTQADKVTTQYSGANTIPGTSAQVVFSARDFESHGSDFDVPVAFDTTDPLNTDNNSGGDPDLASPFINGGTVGPSDGSGPDINPGNILITPEGGNGVTDCSNATFCTQPDDDVNHEITADFVGSVNLVSIDLYDFNDPSPDQRVEIQLFDASDVSLGAAGFFNPAGGGNRTALRLFFGSVGSGVGKMVAHFYGSGGLDNIRGDIVTNPEPATLLLLSLGVLGVALSKRRRQSWA